MAAGRWPARNAGKMISVEKEKKREREREKKIASDVARRKWHGV